MIEKEANINEAMHTRTNGETAPCCCHTISNFVSLHINAFFTALHPTTQPNSTDAGPHSTKPFHSALGRHIPFSLKNCSRAPGRAVWLSTMGNLHTVEQNLAHREQTDLQRKVAREANYRLNDSRARKPLTPPTLFLLFPLSPQCPEQSPSFSQPLVPLPLHFKISVSKSKKSGKLI